MACGFPFFNRGCDDRCRGFGCGACGVAVDATKMIRGSLS
jgi:hypothetical protein